MGLVVALILALQFLGAYTRPVNPGELRPAGQRDNGVALCRLHFRSDRDEAGGFGWQTDYPLAGQNLTIRLSELTTIHITEHEDVWVVPILSDDLFLCPLVLATDVGTMRLSDAEVEQLRGYLHKGGVLWADDFWGTRAWDQWLFEIRRVLPRARLWTPSFDHALYQSLYRVRRTLQVSSARHWRDHNASVAERGERSPETPLQALSDDSGHIMVLMTHNTDIGDTWERDRDDAFADYTATFAPEGYALGINVVLFSLSH